MLAAEDYEFHYYELKCMACGRVAGTWSDNGVPFEPDAPMPVSKSRLSAMQTHAYLETVRWPVGIMCAYCFSEDVYRKSGQTSNSHGWFCRSCSRYFSAVTMTLLQGTKVGLDHWLKATQLLVEDAPIETSQLRLELRMTAPPTTRVRRIIRRAMFQAMIQKPLLERHLEEPEMHPAVELSFKSHFPKHATRERAVLDELLRRIG